MQQLIGQTLGRYQIKSRLGQGGMGAVYKAQDTTLRRDVALKVMHGHLAEHRTFQARFVQEAQAAATLDHPGIVKVYDIVQATDLLYIVMEFVAGSNLAQSLHDLRQAQQWIILPDAVELVQQLAMAVQYAHEAGVLHRDIKPANVMLKPDLALSATCRPVLTDMGLAKLDEGGIVTQTGSSMGTPAYMSPEQALGEKTGPGTDVFSLGVLLYELTVGQLPFPAKTISDALRLHHRGTPPPAPRSLRPDLPLALEKTILTALAHDQSKRLASAGALALALDKTDPATLAPSVPASSQVGVSLGTLYQQSLINQPPSPVEHLPKTDLVVDDGVDHIQILELSGASRTVLLNTAVMTIGRGGENTIVIDEGNASRNHARIEFDGFDYYIVDLNSANGTYLGSRKLAPNARERWRTDSSVRIGQSELRLRHNRAHSTPMPVDNTFDYGYGGTKEKYIRTPSAEVISKELPKRSSLPFALAIGCIAVLLGLVLYFVNNRYVEVTVSNEHCTARALYVDDEFRIRVEKESARTFPLVNGYHEFKACDIGGDSCGESASGYWTRASTFIIWRTAVCR